MVNQLHWLPFTTRIQFKACFGPQTQAGFLLQNISDISYALLILQHLFNLSTLWTGMISFCYELGSLWPRLNYLHHWVCLVECPTILSMRVVFFLDLFLHLSSEHISSLGLLALGELLYAIGHYCDHRYMSY